MVVVFLSLEGFKTVSLRLQFVSVPFGLGLCSGSGGGGSSGGGYEGPR